MSWSVGGLLGWWVGRLVLNASRTIEHGHHKDLPLRAVLIRGLGHVTEAVFTIKTLEGGVTTTTDHSSLTHGLYVAAWQWVAAGGSEWQ